MKDNLEPDRCPFTIRPLTIENGRDALKAALLTLKEFGDPIPMPGAFGAASGQWRQRVPKTLHARLVERAKQEGVSLNTLVTAMIAEGLGQRQSRRRGR